MIVELIEFYVFIQPFERGGSELWICAVKYWL